MDVNDALKDLKDRPINSYDDLAQWMIDKRNLKGVQEKTQWYELEAQKWGIKPFDYLIAYLRHPSDPKMFLKLPDGSIKHVVKPERSGKLI